MNRWLADKGLEDYSCVKALVRLFLNTCPLAKISARYSELEYRIQEKQVLPKGGVLASLIVKQTSETDAFFRSLNTSDKVKSLNFLYFGKYQCKVRIDFDCRSCMFLKLNEDMRISSDYIYYKNGGMEAAFSLKDHGEFRALLGYFKKAGIGFKVLEVKRTRGDVPGDGVREPALIASANLTPKQLEILRHAYHSGYFDRDRKVNLGEIAEHFGLSPATVGVHMRVGLKKILKKIM